MFVQLPLIIVAVTVLLLGIASELAASLLGVDLSVLTQVMGVSEETLEATLYIVAIAASVMGLVLLRGMPRELAPMGAVGPADKVVPGEQHERVAHVNNPLQSVYVAVILIAGVLAFSSLS